MESTMNRPSLVPADALIPLREAIPAFLAERLDDGVRVRDAYVQDCHSVIKVEKVLRIESLLFVLERVVVRVRESLWFHGYSP
jgi:hypothetical protein